jgi:tetratricopeptide (TPR) repeat protein
MSLAPNDVTARRNFTQAAMALNQSPQAMQVWEQWMQAHPQDAQAPAMLGMLYESAGDPGNAMKMYRKSLNLNPNQPAVDNQLAYLMAQNGQDLDVALSLAESARQGLPNSPDTADTLAWIYYKKGLYPSALDLLQQAEQADPGNATIEYHLGMTDIRMNNKSDATTHLKRATQLAPNSDSGKSAAQALSTLG